MAPCPPSPRTPTDEPHLSPQDSAPPLWFLLRCLSLPSAQVTSFSTPSILSLLHFPACQRHRPQSPHIKGMPHGWPNEKMKDRVAGAPPHLEPVRLPPRLQQPGCRLSLPFRAGAGGTGSIRLRSLLRGSVGRMARSGLLLGLQESGG